MSHAKRRRREHKLMQRRYKTKMVNRHRYKKNRAQKGKTKVCLRCPAALICNTEGPPYRIYRCVHCNRTLGDWGDMYDFAGHTTHPARHIVGIKRCPHTRIRKIPCDDCKKRLGLEKRSARYGTS